MSNQNKNQPLESNIGELPFNQNSSAVINRATKRPKLVWLISTVLVGTVAIFDAFFVARLLGYGSDSAFALDLSTFTAVDYLRRLVSGVVSLAAGIYLFLLRKIAVLLFFMMFVYNSVLFMYAILSGGTPSITLFTLAILGLLYWYSLRLKRQGVLV